MTKLTPGQMVALPWSWRGPARKLDEHGNEWWEITITELGDFFVAGSSREEAVSEAADALEAFLTAIVDAGDLPIPAFLADNAEMTAHYARAREPQLA